MRGFLLTFEGIDGCGKSTQLTPLAAALGERGWRVRTTRQPGGTATGQAIRSLMVAQHRRLAPLAELLLMMADRAQHVAEFIKPHLQAGDLVISDRYADSSVAFQGYGRGIDLATVEQLNQLATGGLTPDLTILFDVDVETARRRLAARATHNEGITDNADAAMRGFDEEQHDFHRRVRDGYRALAERYPQRFRVLDATGSIEETGERLLTLVLAALRKSGVTRKSRV